MDNIVVLEAYSTDRETIRDTGINCTRCNNISYSGGTLIFNTTSFSSFTANESAAGGGGNSPPTAPRLIYLTAENTTTNRTPEFVWNVSTDADNNPISYNIMIDDNPAFNNPEVNVTELGNTTPENVTYLITTELEPDIVYWWVVRANDSTEYGTNDTIRNFTVQSYLAITLINDTIWFGNVNPGRNENTTDNDPPPFRAENTGNVIANVTINGSRYFLNADFPSGNYTFKIRENESGAFNSTSQTTFINMNVSSSVPHVYNLDWHGYKNDFLMDLNITVPGDEPPGLRTSTITFTIES